MAAMTSLHAEVLPSGEYTRSICPVHMQQARSRSIVHSYLLMCNLVHSAVLIGDKQ